MSHHQEAPKGSLTHMGLPVWAVAYGLCAMTSGLLIKTLIVYHGFSNFSMVALVQSALAASMLAGQARPALKLVLTRPSVLALLLLPTAFNTASAMLGFYSQARVNVPMMLVLRRTNTIFTLFAERLFIGRIPTWEVTAACLVAVCGALVAGFRDLGFDGFGYCLVCFQNVATTAATISLFFASRKLGIDGSMMTFLNSLLAIPMMLLWATASDSALPLTVSSMPWLVALIFVGCANLYCSTKSVTVHSPLTTSIAGNTKDLFQTLVGAFAFADYTWDVMNVLGIGVSFWGCALYVLAKKREAKVSAKTQ